MVLAATFFLFANDYQRIEPCQQANQKIGHGPTLFTASVKPDRDTNTHIGQPRLKTRFVKA